LLFFLFSYHTSQISFLLFFVCSISIWSAGHPDIVSSPLHIQTMEWGLSTSGLMSGGGYRRERRDSCGSNISTSSSKGQLSRVPYLQPSLADIGCPAATLW
jgi:hypothetical protein